MARSPTINVMVRTAQRAGRRLVRDFGEVENLQVSEKGPSDFVSVADTRAERTIREELERARPGYGFLMEESGVIEGRDKTHRWIVDPLDGTLNFLHGIPHFCISIALEREGEIVAGVVYHPLTDETYWAEKNQGAFLSDRRLRVSSRRRLAEAVITTGIPHRGGIEPDAYLPSLRRLMPLTAGIRRMGSAALDLAYVASGRCEAYWEPRISSWDIAAGVLIVREAGGFATTLDGGPDPVGTGSILAANTNLHGEILGLLNADN